MTRNVMATAMGITSVGSSFCSLYQHNYAEYEYPSISGSVSQNGGRYLLYLRIRHLVTRVPTIVQEAHFDQTEHCTVTILSFRAHFFDRDPNTDPDHGCSHTRDVAEITEVTTSPDNCQFTILKLSGTPQAGCEVRL